MGRKYRVLIIDDDPSTRTLMRVLLEHEGFDVFQAPDGEIGVELATNERPDCILLDLAMPRRSGFDVYSDLQQSSAAAIPIIVFSAILNRTEEDRWRSMPHVVDTIRKPFDIDQIVGRIGEVCEQTVASQE